MIEVKRYQTENKIEWNDFLSKSNFPNILINRSYMDYHKDRFIDYSLLVMEKNELVAIIPANLSKENNVISHQGLTFGGVYTNNGCPARKTIEFLAAALEYLSSNNIKKFELRLPPTIYGDFPVDEINYALFTAGISPYRIDTTLAINNQLDCQIAFQNRRVRSIKKAIKRNPRVQIGTNFEPFWNKVLCPNLNDRFGVKPVHTLEEMTQLEAQNQGGIVQFDCVLDNAIVAGATIFESKYVAHAQYISSTNEGRNSGALDFLFSELIKYYSDKKRFFNFGIANENKGKEYNQGLLDWKEGFGARTFNQPFFLIETSKFAQLKNLIN